ncbi:MAG: ABC transporter permease [Deltaproteobacteria bacterium]|nr:ABC transporter permease [Deltaproteobacteria bacterium]
MTLLETLRTAVTALLRNKLRSFLTTLGVIIGVSAVIAMVAIGEGAKAQVEQAFASMGANLLIIQSGSTTTGGARGGFGSLPTLTWDDLQAIQTESSSVRYAAPVLRTTAQIASEEQNWTTSITGTTPEYFAIRNWLVSLGVAFGQAEVDGGAKVALLGQTVADKLYGSYVDPVGQTVRIQNVPFQIVGVLAKKGQSGMGQDYDDVALVPQTTFQARIQGGLQQFITGNIFVSATSSAATARAQTQIVDLLRDRHHIQPEMDDDFSIRNLSEMESAQQEGTKTMTTLLASVATVSLLVGGIGIMNIMLVSVTERTREIGLRMAVGAKPRDVLAQFLLEALTLSFAGGLLGIGLGIAVASHLADQFGWPMLIRPDIIVISVGFSALVGVGFGLYPALKASRLDPIVALRFE